MTFKNNANPGSNEKKSTQLSFDKLFKHWIAVAVLIFALSFGIRLFRLDFHSLWYDEANTAFLLQDKPMGTAFDAILGTSGSETLHPLYYLILSAWMQVAGDSEPALRFPSVIFGSAATVIYALLLYQIGGTKTFAFGALLVVSPFIMWYSREARPYALIMFITGLHLLLYLKLLVKPKSRMVLVGFVLTGVLMVYSGIFVGMLLAAEFVWSLLFRRNFREASAIVLVLLLSIPLVWHAWQTHFVKSSERYYELPKGMNAVRTVAIPQEFLVGRSLGPTPDEVRRLPLREIVRNKPFALAGETLAIISIVIAFLVSFWSLERKVVLHQSKNLSVQALSFITITCIVELTVLVLFTGYRINARHLSFLFGPIFVLSILPIAYSNKRLSKVAFVSSLLLLWGWSCTNQIFDSSYMTEDYRSAARIISNGTHDSSQILGLCHFRVLQYYGIDNPFIYFREASTVTCDSLITYLRRKDDPSWVVLSRPWNYPNFHAEELEQHFQVLQTKQLPGISMWLLSSHD